MGSRLSVEVTAACLALGIPLGLVLALGVQSKRRAVSVLSRWSIVEIGRGAPALILLQFAYFGLPNAGLALSSFTSATLALAWTTGAYTSEIIRAGLDAVPFGQKEAAAAIGLSGLDALQICDPAARPARLDTSAIQLLNSDAAGVVAVLCDRAAGAGQPSLCHRIQYVPLHVDLRPGRAALRRDLHSRHDRRFSAGAPARAAYCLNFAPRDGALVVA